jgi:hypothetical protein
MSEADATPSPPAYDTQTRIVRRARKPRGPSERRAFVHDGDRLHVVSWPERPPTLFREAGVVATAGELAHHDAVLDGDTVLEVSMDDGLVVLQHPWIGVQRRWEPSYEIDSGAVALDRVERAPAQVSDDA